MTSVKFLMQVVFALSFAPLKAYGQPAGTISLESVAGEFGGDSIQIGVNVVFSLRYTNAFENSWNISNGFVINSPDGADWSGPVFGDTISGLIPSSNFDAIFVMNSFIGTAIPRRDTIGIAGAFITGEGLPPGFDGVPYSIAIGQFVGADIGKHICIDTSFFRTGGYWKWAAPGGLVEYPEWDGPYCFTIGHCCDGVTGDADGDNAGTADISDLIFIIDYLFRAGPPSVCFGEADVDGNCAVDISDLTYLIDHMFRLGPPLVDCHSCTK